MRNGRIQGSSLNRNEFVRNGLLCYNEKLRYVNILISNICPTSVNYFLVQK